MTIYRLIMALLLPALVAGALWRRLRGHGASHELAERLALRGRGTAPVIWMHGASNGEIASARWLIEEILARDDRLEVLVSCNNPTARAMVAAWALPQVRSVLAPWDTRGAVRRFLRRWRPRALLVLENELWPERIAGCAAEGVPVLAIAARLSERSARSWARLAPGLLRRTLDQLAWLSAQDAASERRLVAAGLPQDRLGPRLVLKAGVAGASPAEPPFPAPPRARCLLAASTHDGEDAAVLDAFLAARAQFDLLVIAPRHPQRGPAIAALATARGLAAGLRSRGEGATGPVYVADTLGEMGLWYALCGTTFIGGTLVAKGGHTPFEPIAAGSALVHGPSVHNFAEIFAALDASGGAVPVTGEADLAPALNGLSPERQARLAAVAARLPQRADPRPILDALDRLARRPG
ncbi:3-deoxy-D-manno-octulosonic acid transferase [Cereibacter sphaeroides]|uniref:3-deoxy-D-manno-octulosonic acid transferase n=1 Tax=Cereibacter sphaeroides TaxID=1063 RepID=UPI001F4751A6|nr:glycosyltransferase N-terminal domain-containing protein [Cereibacter sphaeroides]MCE6961462.1 3-deoxy-D-manno-octulosonic acid transferase [Cereibacter sphaeroides]MCE6973857.1 3-deoxy-D-manno-octulosonic acid transferase [Cereibacter sphaeroides]